MARKSKKKNKDAGAAWLPAWENITRAAATATTIILSLALAIGLLAGRGPLQARATQVVREPVRVLFDWPPLAAGAPSRTAAGATQPTTWLDSNTQGHLQALALHHLSADPFDADSLARARGALAATGWFSSGPVLRRESAAVVRVEGRWRVPFAVVRSTSGGSSAPADRLVTLRGELLDKSYAPNASGLPVILGASAMHPARTGDAWAGTDVHAGLQLLATLRGRPWAEQVAAIDVSGFATRNQRQLWIVTRAGGRILWGGPADSPLPGEQSTAVKLRHLDTIVARSGGRLDGGQPSIDIRLKDVLVDAGRPAAVPSDR
jgi:hypothetical protein